MALFYIQNISGSAGVATHVHARRADPSEEKPERQPSEPSHSSSDHPRRAPITNEHMTTHASAIQRSYIVVFNRPTSYPKLPFTTKEQRASWYDKYLNLLSEHFFTIGKPFWAFPGAVNIKRIPMLPGYSCTLDDGDDQDVILERIRTDPLVDSVEVNFRLPSPQLGRRDQLPAVRRNPTSGGSPGSDEDPNS
ncbi:MAG: hypothetical protein M1831_001763 [Alyxoria varia]|nr:MAG: hypothetical protein M1831_001763 [Alyxoria varia]